MKLVFLTSPYPWVKDADGQYPYNKEWTSHERDVNSLADFAAVIGEAAKAGGCLLKGLVERPLRAESRQGATDPDTPTEWLCFDIDGIIGADVPSVMAKLGFKDVNYLYQLSASHGKKHGKVCAHVFMLLDRPVDPKAIKDWLTDLNLTKLDDEVTLAKSGAALIFPLDVSACQNDKQIACAHGQPAIIIGGHALERMPANRIKAGKTSRYVKKINELRTLAGLSDVRQVTRNAAGTEVAAHVQPIPLCDIKEERGFVYFDIGGNGRWSYYHPEDNPKFIRNFKGEPLYLTSELFPDYWKARVSSGEIEAKQAEEQDSEGDLPKPFAFYAHNLGGSLHLGFRNQKSGVVEDISKQSGVNAYKSVMAAYGLEPLKPEEIPTVNVVYNPTMASGYSLNNGSAIGKVNTFRASEAMLMESSSKQRASESTLAEVRRDAPQIGHLLNHVMNGHTECQVHFLNWLAYLLQVRRKIGVAWLLTGAHGTGKNTLAEHVVGALVGRENWNTLQAENLEDQFNGYMADKMFTLIDEADFRSKAAGKPHLINQLKAMITSENYAVRRMQVAVGKEDSWNAFFINSNEEFPIPIALTDRRFNIPPYQPEPIRYTEVELKKIAEELMKFAKVIASIAPDEAKAKSVIMTQQRKKANEVTTSIYDQMMHSLKQGDIKRWLDLLPPPPKSDEPASLAEAVVLDRARKALTRLFDPASSYLGTADIKSVWVAINGNSHMTSTPAIFQRTLRSESLEVEFQRYFGGWEQVLVQRRKAYSPSEWEQINGILEMWK